MALLRRVLLVAIITGLAAHASQLSERQTVDTFINRTSCRRPQPPGVPCDPLLDAFGQEASTAGLAKISHGEAAASVRRWYQSLSQHHNGLQLTREPQQMHISITGSEGNVSVLWTTSTTSENAEVCWWPQGNANASQCAAGGTWTYTPISVMPWTGNIHGGYMVGLSSGSTYCYTVGDPVLGTSSNATCFVAPSTSWTDESEFLFFMGGDMGTYQFVGHKVAKQMRDDEVENNLKVDAFWLLGDIAYSTLDPPKDNFEFFWDLFLQQEESLANHVPMLTTYGNHDFGGGDSAAFLNRFRNPLSGDSGSPFYWSYDHGPIRFVSMCTEMFLEPVHCAYHPGSKQYRWLEEQFSTVNRTRTPWLVLAGHRPMYSSDRSTDSGPLREFIEPLLTEYGVDVEVSGHMHETEVVSPVANYTASLAGVTIVDNSTFIYDSVSLPAHLTIGTLGAVIAERFENPTPSWSLFRSGAILGDAYGYVQLRANRTSLAFEFKRESDRSTMWSLQMRK